MVQIEVNVPIEEIAERCIHSEEALKEHDAIYKVPVTNKVLDELIQGFHGYLSTFAKRPRQSSVI